MQGNQLQTKVEHFLLPIFVDKRTKFTNKSKAVSFSFPYIMYQIEYAWQRQWQLLEFDLNQKFQTVPGKKIFE